MFNLTRKDFIRVLGGFFAAIWTAFATYPFFRYLMSGAEKKTGEDSQVTSLSLGKADDFIPGSSKNFKFGSIPALMVRTEDGVYHAYNAICTHLGCTVQFSSEKKHIFCACHGGQFDAASGKNLAGPPPKPLAALKAEVISGELIISRA